MPASHPPTNHSSRFLVYLMLGIILLFIAAFLVLHPNATGAGPSKTNTTSDHSSSSIQPPAGSKLK